MTAIRWTSNREVVDVPITEQELSAARVAAVELQISAADVKAERRRANDAYDAVEGEIAARLARALRQAKAKVTGVHAVIGYDLDAGELVLAHPTTRQELRRRPLTEAERRIAEKMPEPPAP